MPQTGYTGLPQRWYVRNVLHVQDALFRISIWGNNVMRGKTNNVGTVTLAASVATTTLNDPRIGGETAIMFMPTTANAAAEIGGGTLYVTARGDGSCTLNHANNVQTDRIFDYTLTG